MFLPDHKKQQKIESKERILNVASRLFKKNGFSSTGIDQVMAEAGLTSGGFYAHFESKTDLLEQVIEHSFKFSKQLLMKDIEHLPAEEKIQTVMSRYVSILHRDLPEKGCIIPSLASEIYR
ncbi:MAG: TetR/AcrR family transcriptional regulator, partial [Bdellovibrionota bacterium]